MFPPVTAGSQRHEYQQSQDRKQCKQADLESELGTKHSRKDKSRSKKTKTVCQERGEGQTYGAGMLWLGEDCEERRCAHKARSDFVSFCTNLHADYGYCFQVDFS